MEQQKKRVLLIEDDAAMRGALGEVLTEAGMAVLEATDGDNGLTTALKERPDLILLDLLMPHLGGIGFLGGLRKDPWGKQVPVIVLTNLNSTQTVADAFENGSYDYLVKANVSMAEVVAKIRERLAIPNKEKEG